MSKIIIAPQTEPDTPATDKASIYVDSVTKRIQSKDDAGVVSKYVTEASDKVMVSSNDTTPGYLNGKLTVTANAGVALTEVNDAGDEDLNVTIDINGTTDKITPVVADELLIGDTEDSNAIKKADIASVVNLADHDQLTNFTADEHFTMLDEDDMATDSATQAATQQSIKAYVVSGLSGKENSFSKNTAFNKDFTVTATDIKMNGVQAVGVLTTVAPADHVHPVDTSRQAAGSYESPLTFSSGVTRTVNDVTNNLITGLAGGQTIIGGTAAGENLTLTSTSNATKGNIILGSTSGVVFDGVNNKLGIGISIPTAIMHVKGAGSSIFMIDRTNTSTSAPLQIGIFKVTTSGDMVNNYGPRIVLAIEDSAAVENNIAYFQGVRDGADNTGMLGFGIYEAGTITRHTDFTSTGVRLAKTKIYPFADGTSAINFTANNGTTSILNIDTTNNRVGIGTTTPASRLDVSNTTGGTLTLTREDTSVTANDMVGKIQFYAKDISTTTNFIVADIEAQANNTVTTDINPGKLIFRTTPATVAGVPIERMRIMHTGLVGIATDSPTGALDVSSGLLSIIMGADVSVTTRTNITNKYGRFGSYHYTNAEEPLAIMNAVSTVDTGWLQFGGGAANMNTATLLTFYTAANNTTLSGSDRMNIDSTGVVNINGGTYSQSATRTLSQKLEVHTSAGYGGMSLNTWSTTDSHGPVFDFNKSGHATVGSHTIVNADEKLGYIIFRGSDGTAFRDAAVISADIDGTPGASDMPGRLTFSTTADGAAVATEKMRITNAGYVGIGTTSPSSLLDISSGSLGLTIGANSGSTTRTNATTKNARIGSYHYTNAEEPVSMILAVNANGSNTLYFGGGSSLQNAATEIKFFTDASFTQTTGSEKVSIDSARLKVSNAIFSLGANDDATLSSGAFTMTSSHMKLDTEGAAASDDLDTINSGADGDILILRTTTSTRDIVVKHATGNIRLAGGADITLNDAYSTVTLIYTAAQWCEISRSLVT